MIKINAGFSRKVGEANYSSRGAAVNVELELESGLISDPNALMARIRHLFDLARQSVDDELSGSSNQRNEAHVNGVTNGHEPVRPATSAQIKAIRTIGSRSHVNVEGLAADRHGVRSLEDLTIRQASDLIDELKSPTRQNA